MVVYVLFHETNSGHAPDESDGYVEAVYATEALAEHARREIARSYRQRGKAIWRDYDGPIDQEENLNWQHDWRIEAHQIHDAS